MRFCLAVVVLIISFTTSSLASDKFKTIESKHSVSETLDRLTKILKSKGIKIMARVDHAAGAKGAGLELPPTQLLIFGNPKLGTPLMQANRMIGLDLPMKALAWEGASGKVFLSYTTPGALQDRHQIKQRDKIFGIMTKALGGLTAAAAGKK